MYSRKGAKILRGNLCRMIPRWAWTACRLGRAKCLKFFMLVIAPFCFPFISPIFDHEGREEHGGSKAEMGLKQPSGLPDANNRGTTKFHIWGLTTMYLYSRLTMIPVTSFQEGGAFPRGRRLRPSSPCQATGPIFSLRLAALFFVLFAYLSTERLPPWASPLSDY